MILINQPLVIHSFEIDSQIWTALPKQVVYDSSSQGLSNSSVPGHS